MTAATENLRILGEADPQTIEQMENCLAGEDGAVGVLLPDNHLGYSQPIGGAVAYREHISVSGVGYDIGCGNKAVRTDILFDEIESYLPAIMDKVEKRLHFGVGGKVQGRYDHEVLDKIKVAPFEGQREMYDLAASSLGTIGGGNHYVDLFRDDEDLIWIGVHFGSRGFGWNTCDGFLALHAGLPFSPKFRRDHKIKTPTGGMMSAPVIFALDSAEGQGYLAAMELAGEYAYAGRDIVVNEVLDILENPEVMDSVHNHHNYAWLEDGAWVVRKGCTPAFPGQRGFVGATMGEDSVILHGTTEGADYGFSTIHGAGRAMSRNEAAGKSKRRKRWECNHRDCDYSHTDLSQFTCPDHPDAKPMKRHWSEQVTEGKIDFTKAVADLRVRGIELRGGAADEAPLAYKRLDEVLQACGPTIDIEHFLHPIGVAMAGAGVPRDD